MFTRKGISFLRRDPQAQSGNAYVEFLLCLPFVLTILIGIVDLGRALVMYLALSRLTYEGARYMATLPGLTEGGCETSPTNPICASPAHEAVRERLIPIFQDGLIRAAEATVQTEVFGPTTRLVVDPTLTGDAKTSAEVRVVRVTITAPFEPLFPTFGLLRSLTAHSSGPYLLQVAP